MTTEGVTTMKWFRNMKIGTKVTVMVAMLMVITLATLGLISFNSASNALLKSYESSLTTQASQTAELLGKELKKVRTWMNEVAEEVGRAQDSNSLKNELKDFIEDQGYDYLGYTGIDNTGVSAQGDVVDLSGLAGYQQALAGETNVTRPEVFEDDGELYFYAFAPVFDGNGSVKGVTSAMIPYEDIYSEVSDIKIGQTGYVVVLDEIGAVAMHPVVDQVINKVNNTIQQPDKPELNAIVALQQRAITGETGFGQFIINGVVKYMAFSPVTDANFEVLLSVPKAELFTEIDQQMYSIIIASVTSLLVIMAALLLFVRTQISRPLKKTADFAKELSSGNHETNMIIKSRDEVGRLSSILDKEVREAFKSIEQNRKISEKQSRYSNEQVDKLVVNLERLSRGELNCDMTVTEPDEDTKETYILYTRISDNLHATISSIKGYIGEISDVLGEMSKGNLDVSITAEYLGEFVTLKDSINGIAGSLNEVLGEIGTAADQVASGTKQVSDGSQEISQGATEQSSSIEELTASVSQIAEQTRQNAMSANKASELTVSAAAEATRGNERMKAMQDAMSQINEASRSISKIIKVIDDIAFQTNILALNAAVEAARAGVHGKGFAVVAEEVRNLAARSAGAAKETTELIEGSISKTEAGTRIADETAGALVSIVEGVDKAAQLVGEIANASNEQASAITQVNHGIEQMSQVVQTNSATSEETAAAAEELSSQAEFLKSMVGQFNLKNLGTAVSAPIIAAKASAPVLSTAKINLTDSDFGKY